MASDIDPIIGTWYQNLTEKSQRFEVVSVDEDAATVEVQHFDGDIEEWDIDQWHEMDLELIEPPENWTGPVDDVTEEERHDLTYMDSDMSEEEWEEPLQETKRPKTGEDEEAFGGDEWGEPRPSDEGEEPEAPGPEGS